MVDYHRPGHKPYNECVIITMITLSCAAAAAASGGAAPGKKMGKVMFDYEATQADELTIKVDDVVEVINEDEPGWYVCMLHTTYIVLYEACGVCVPMCEHVWVPVCVCMYVPVYMCVHVCACV